MSSSNTMKPPSTETLRTMDAGDVYVPADAGYGPARRARDLAVDQRLAVVVLAESAVDTARTVRFARSQGMRIAPQATGHGALPVELLEGAMLDPLRLGRPVRSLSLGWHRDRVRRPGGGHRLVFAARCVAFVNGRG